MPTTDRLTALELRVDELIGAVNALRERFDTHVDNHHSRVSTMKLGGMVGGILSLLYAAVEILRRFVL